MCVCNKSQMFPLQFLCSIVSPFVLILPRALETCVYVSCFPFYLTSREPYKWIYAPVPADLFYAMHPFVKH